MSSRISCSGTPVLPVASAVPQPVELLEPAFALHPRSLRYRWARPEFSGEVFEQDLLFRMGQFVHGDLNFGERAHARKSSTSRSSLPSQWTGGQGCMRVGRAGSAADLHLSFLVRRYF
jgi:hypothetical protein